jgi:RHS repeat-associated protein
VTYAGSAAYTPSGTPTALALGGGNINLSEAYNPRHQPFTIHAVSGGSTDLLNLSYHFGLGNADNGNVLSISNLRDNGRTQYFAYDALNRIVLANSQATSGSNCWGQAFGYDPWGNLTSISATQCATPGLSVSVGNNNRITSSGFSYDSAGNLLTDGVYTYTWNAEGRMATVTSSLYGSESYTYDGDGHRVRKQTAGKLYWYGADGEVLAETDAAGNNPTEYIYLGGSRIARRGGTGNVSYYFTDMLGSSRVIADASGNLCYDADFLPFGSEITYANTCPQNYKFAGMERDPEGQLDHTRGRQFASNYGRWISPDPSRLGAFVEDPQSWNMYSYAYNNPLRFVDQNGMWPTWIHNKIIDTAFPNLTAEQRQILKDVSEQQDSLFSGGQGNALAFQHAMRAPAETVPEAAAKFEQFVGLNEDEATKTQVSFWLAGNPGLSNKALTHFAAALHAIMDSTSPAHSGFQRWNWMDVHGDVLHHYAENSITPQQLQDAVFAARMEFNSVFRDPFRDPFFNPPSSWQPTEHVTSRICYSGEGGKMICQ